MNNKIIQIIGAYTGHKHCDITPEKTLVDNLGADSLDIIQIAMELEEEFGITISDEQCEAWNTVQDVIECVERLEKEHAAAV